MVGRAELAYLIVQMAHSSGRLSDEGFCICVWALLYASLSAPFFLRWALRSYVLEHGGASEGAAKSQEATVSCTEGRMSGHGGNGSAAFCHEEEFLFSGNGAKDSLSSSENAACEIDVLKDLESIKLESCLEDEEGFESQGAPMPGVVGKRSEEPDVPWLLESCNEADRDGPDRGPNIHGDTARSRSPAASAIFPGSRPMSHGFLCCLFFRRIVVD